MLFRSNLPKSIELPPFPKKQLNSHSHKLVKSRQQLLETWLQAVLLHKESQVRLLEFLSAPDSIIFSVKKSTGCILSVPEKIVANLILQQNRLHKSGKKLIKDFDSTFFESTEQSLSSNSINSFFNFFLPLCSNPCIACESIDILSKLVTLESYRFADQVKENLVNNIDLLKEIRLDKHILNEFGQQTGLQGYTIASVIKETLDRKSKGHFFDFVLNYNHSAIQQFHLKMEGKKSKSSQTSSQVLCDNWNWLCTDNYSGGLKIAYRKKELMEVKAEILIEATVEEVEKNVLENEIRKKWDLFMQDFKIEKKDLGSCFIRYELKMDKKRVVDMDLDIRVKRNDRKVLISFDSRGGNARFEACFYEISPVEDRSRMGSASTDDIENEEENSRKKSSKSIEIKDFEVCKFVIFLRMNDELARYFVSDLSEETSILKESMAGLKRQSEMGH